MKKSTLLLLGLVGMLLVFAGNIWAETTSQYRNQYQNRNQIQNRRQKQSLACSNLVAGGTLVGYTVAECTYDGLTLTKDTETIIVNGLGPVSYWDSYSPEAVPRPSTDDVVTVQYMVNNTTGKNILISLTYLTSEGDPGVTILLRDEVTGCPLWR